jgi:hypothetical protein
MDLKERDCYRSLHLHGETALEELVGPEITSRLLSRWEDEKLIKIVNQSPGRSPKPIVLMTAEEHAAWDAHVLANSGYEIKTYAKYAK